MTADSVISIKLPELGICASQRGAEAVAVCKPFLYLLHWVIQYDCEEHPHCAMRQVLRGMVYGLYQRHVLGDFENQLVFGMAHHSTRKLDVFAATWEFPEATMENTNGEGKSMSNMAAETGEDDGNRDREDDIIDVAQERIEVPSSPKVGPTLTV